MNNNRNNNTNRRRGRGNRQQGGGNQNRIDSRARGNAPQMFDKYKKLAQDAAHNGDRVQAEYFLQFADHYFRVIADNKARQDEVRGGGRRDERDYQSDDEGEDDEFDVMRPPQSSGRFNDRQVDRQGGDRSSERPHDRQRPEVRRDEAPRARAEGEPGYEGQPVGETEPAENPFTRDNRRRERDPERVREGARDGESRRGRGRRPAPRDAQEAAPVSDSGEIDATALPPSFSSSGDGGSGERAEEAAPKRTLPPRRRRAPAGEPGDDGDPLKAVG